MSAADICQTGVVLAILSMLALAIFLPRNRRPPAPPLPPGRAIEPP